VPAGGSNLSSQEREEFGIELKPKRIAEEAGFNVHENSLVDGDSVWYMSNPPVKFNSENKKTGIIRSGMTNS
jgi:hypothetical protein